MADEKNAVDAVVAKATEAASDTKKVVDAKVAEAKKETVEKVAPVKLSLIHI